MKNLRRSFEGFCYRNRNVGIPNLMLWIVLGNIIVYFVDLMDPSHGLFQLLYFDRTAIMHGQVWRLFSYVFLELLGGQNVLFLVLFAIFYYQLGAAVENSWGRCKFTLYYLTGIVFLDIAGFLFDVMVLPDSLHMTLFLAYATMYPDATFLVFFIIPVKARFLALLPLAAFLFQLFSFRMFPYNLLPIFVLATYFLYFGADFLNLFPMSWRVNADRLRKKAKPGAKAKTIQFPKAGSYEASHATVNAPYHHRCTICGRTDISNPELEFRYCSKCKGYYCYCEDHINNHPHIE